jgi:hypothetical protein
MKAAAWLGFTVPRRLDLVFQRIKGNPRQFPPVDGDVHRALLRHFPYGVYFLVESEGIKGLAVLHLHREPDMWKSRN